VIKNTKHQTNERYCIIGAGPSGLAAARNFAAAGIEFDCFERQDEVGGNWYYGSPHSSVYKSTHLISSKFLTEFSGFRMPREYPHYPSHRQVFDYMRSFAEHYELYQHITFEKSVEHVRPVEGGGWQVQIEGETTPRDYAGVVIANGHHWNPRFPKFPGNFAGRIMHAHEYLDPSSMVGERVLVVGAGNSGCDIAVDMVGNATDVGLSMRRGYHFLPKFLYGIPLDRCEYIMRHKYIRGWLFRLITWLSLRVAVGPIERYGLPKPDHRLFSSHPIVNSKILSAMGHGQIKPVPNIAGLEGSTVHFTDGTSREFDTIIYATGYKLSFPFIDVRHLGCVDKGDGLDNEDASPWMPLHIFSPVYDNLYVVGLIQPNGGLWKLADYQSQVIARQIVAKQEHPEVAKWFSSYLGRLRPSKKLKKYVASPRHSIEVEYNAYREKLEKLISDFDRRGVTELADEVPLIRLEDRMGSPGSPSSKERPQG